LEEEKRYLPQTFSGAILNPPIRKIPDSWGKAPGGQGLGIRDLGSGGGA